MGLIDGAPAAGSAGLPISPHATREEARLQGDTASPSLRAARKLSAQLDAEAEAAAAKSYESHASRKEGAATSDDQQPTEPIYLDYNGPTPVADEVFDVSHWRPIATFTC